MDVKRIVIRDALVEKLDWNVLPLAKSVEEFHTTKQEIMKEMT